MGKLSVNRIKICWNALTANRKDLGQAQGLNLGLEQAHFRVVDCFVETTFTKLKRLHPFNDWTEFGT